MMSTQNQKVWLVTGTSKGLGLHLTKTLLSLGYVVIATSRNTDILQHKILENRENLYPVKLDITSDKAVKECIEKIMEKLGRIDVVVNNAGYSLVGSMEEMSDEEFRATMDVNLFGTVNIIRHLMPYFRKRKHGHIINISSNAGYIGFEKASSYNASKFALIGISEALAEEVGNFGIKVSVVAPGQFRTEFMNSINYVKKRIDVYGVNEAEKMWSGYSGTQPGDPDKLAKILVQISEMPYPPLHLLLGPDTYELVTQKRKREDAEFEQWKSLTLSTNFD